MHKVGYYKVMVTTWYAQRTDFSGREDRVFWSLSLIWLVGLLLLFITNPVLSRFEFNRCC